MPIYAYKCESCGHSKDVLQKMSDAPLTDCPACGAATFKKQLTAAGFQLKGSGWYATDFKGGSAAPAGKSETAGAGSSVETKSETKTETKTDSKPPEPSTPKSTAAPAASSGGCGGSCSCH
jgi:putative FmdB family regulatory protein